MSDEGPVIEQPPSQDGSRHDAAPVSRTLVVLLGALSAFAPLSIDMYLPGLPAMQRQFHAPASLAQLTLTACLVGLAGAQLFIGPLSDRIGRRRPLLIGVALYAAASLACAAVPSLGLLVGLRLLQGAAGAAGIVIARASVRDLRSGAAAARLFSLLLVVNGFAPALAPVIGAQLLHLGSWRVTFIALALLGVALFLFTASSYPETLPPTTRHLHSLSEQLATYGRLLRDGHFVSYALISGFVTGAMFAYISGSPFVLEDIFGLSPTAFSGVFAMNAAGIVASSQLGARLVERAGAKRLLLWGVGMGAFGALVLVISLVFSLGVDAIIVGLFFVVAAVGLVSPNATALAMSDYSEVAGSASGLLGVGQFMIGAALAPVVGVFGVHTAVPMVVLIAVFLLAAAVLAGTLTARDRVGGNYGVVAGEGG